MKNKGLASALVVLILGLIVAIPVAMFFFQYTHESKVRTKLMQEQKSQPISNVPSSNTGSLQIEQTYSYVGIRPYNKWTFQDATGTAVNPTCYIYDREPTTLSAGAYWGDERAFSDESGTYIASGTAASGTYGKNFEAGKKLWYHCTLSGYEDVFGEYTVPLKGSMQAAEASSTNYGLSVGTFTMKAWDTTAWTSSAIDLGVTTNQTNYEYSKILTSTVGKNKKVCLGELRLTQFKKAADYGIEKFVVEIGGGTNPLQSFIIYSNNGGIDKTVYMDSTNQQVYDSDDQGDKNALKSLCWNQDETAMIKFRVWANSRDSVSWVPGYLGNGNVTAIVYLKDYEGNSLINAQNIQG